MMFPHVVTLYYMTQNPVTFQTTNHITILKGVLFDASKGSNIQKTGLENADSVNLYIPFTVEAVDGESLMEKTYVGPIEYEKAEDKSQIWTLDEGNKCFFVKGSVVLPDRGFDYLKLNYDDVYRVTKVDVKDFGTLKHFEVGGN